MSYVKSVFNQYLLGTNIINWINLLIKSKFRINIKCIPKAILITLATILNLPIFIIEHLIYQVRVKNIKIQKDPIFVIGHWRSGTTYLVNLLSKDQRFSYFNVIETFLPSMFLSSYPLLKACLSIVLPKTRPMDKVKIDFHSPQEEEFSIANLSTYSISHMSVFPKDRNKYMEYGLFEDMNKQVRNNWKRNYMSLIKKMTYKYNGKRLLLKSPSNTCKIKEILELFPNAKFIHIYRNPYKVCSSTFKMYKRLFPIFSLQGEIDDQEARDFQLELYERFWKKFLKEKELIPKENLIEIKYENFINNPMKYAQKIYNKLQLPSFSKAKYDLNKYIKSQKSYTPSKHNIPKEVKQRIQKNCKFVFDEYGYEL